MKEKRGQQKGTRAFFLFDYFSDITLKIIQRG